MPVWLTPLCLDRSEIASADQEMASSESRFCRLVVCASIAYPNRAAKSPIMHNVAFEALGLNYVYVAFEPTNPAAAIDGIRALGIHGVSVSKPFKETVLETFTQFDPIARAIGAANTILNDAGSLIGFNSDWIGAVNAIEEISPIHGKKVVIVGAGGAARAIAYGVKARAGKWKSLIERPNAQEYWRLHLSSAWRRNSRI